MGNSTNKHLILHPDFVLIAILCLKYLSFIHNTKYIYITLNRGIIFNKRDSTLEEQ